MKKCIAFILILFSSLIISACASHDLYSDTATGVWVECMGSNDTLSSSSKIIAMLDDVKTNGMNTIYVQVFRHDKAWFKTNSYDNRPYKNFYKKEKKDLLKFVISEAHKRDIKVHAWINIFRIGRNKKSPIIKKYGPSVVTRDNKGRSMLEYPNLQLPGKDNTYYEADGTGYWLDPGDLRVQKYMLGVVKEIVARYKSIDGVQLDFIRLPYTVPFSPGSRFPKGISYGYGKESCKRFQKKYGMNPLKPDMVTNNMQKWDDWRREQITDFVKKAFKIVKKKNKRIELSTAVVCYADRAYLSAFQDWRRWLNENIVDNACLMNYSIDPLLYRYVTIAGKAFENDESKIYTGIGAYLLKARMNIYEQELKDTVSLDVDGIILFSYDSMLKKKEQFTIFKEVCGKN
ncbi:MAG: family 10 glycosylhydrolase [Candidatus Ancaeobacter aquaticus]|nr:family 10 glycosylhydrolase [Candidatus Ancaeobacter aquaticus]